MPKYSCERCAKYFSHKRREPCENINKIISIVGIEDTKKIMDLIQNIRKYFFLLHLFSYKMGVLNKKRCNNLKAVGEPERIKRPWLSIIKQFTLHKKDYRIYQEDGAIIRLFYIHSQKIE